jgi:PKD repeat protein
LDSISTWKLTHFDSLVDVDFTYNSIVGTNEFQFTPITNYYTQDLMWYFGDDTFSNELNPTHDYMFEGSYVVELIGSSVCGSDTSVQILTIGTASINDSKTEDFQVALLSSGSLEISSIPLNFDRESIQINTIDGKSIPFSVHSVNTSKVEIQFNYSGLFFISFKNNGKEVSSQLINKPF